MKKALLVPVLLLSVLSAGQNQTPDIKTKVIKDGKEVKIKVKPDLKKYIGDLNIKYYQKFSNLLLNYKIKKVNFDELSSPFILIDNSENKQKAKEFFKLKLIAKMNNRVLVRYIKVNDSGETVSIISRWLKQGGKIGNCRLIENKGIKSVFNCDGKNIILKLKLRKIQ